ncbi:PKD domain-containing protein [Larkinella sp.]|uniref:PKD domain-containing protein n=1 Tax=Larkinella sp. TaxID=2034517 RepID=UPI003BAB2579
MKFRLAVLVNYFFLLLLLFSSISCKPTITPRPTADFSFEFVTGKPGQVKFSNKSVEAKRYQWKFGDGQTSTEAEPTITFSQDGVYFAELTAKNDVGSDVVSNSVIVTGLYKKLVVDFTYTLVSGVPGRVQLTNKSQNAEGYQWIFGDGQASIETNPIVDYKKNGIYTIQLTAKTADFADNVSKGVVITEFPTIGSVIFWTNGSDGSDIEVYVDNTMQGLVTSAQSKTPACGVDGSVTFFQTDGTYNFYAKSKTRSWSGVVTVKNGECRSKLLAQ